MTRLIDEICPPDVGEEKLGLQLDSDESLFAHIPFQVNIDYSNTLPAGTTLPIEVVIQGPTAGQRSRRLFTRSRPSSVVLTPTTGGRHFILVRELFHNRWQGQLFVDVEGEDLQVSEDR